MNTIKMPQFPKPFWREISFTPYQNLSDDISFDVCIIGGGITGITAGYLLVKEGLKVAILDAGSILNGTTGHTTAKITAQHGLIYDELINHFGVEKAKQYYLAAEQSRQFIKKTIESKKIDCDFQMEDAYVYAITDQSAQKIHNEMEAYQKLDIQGQIADTIPFATKTSGVIIMNNQSQFHPLKYLKELVKDFIQDGGVIYENTTAIDVEEGTENTVLTREGHKLTCKYVIAASHFPFCDKKGFYFTRMYAERSYVIAIKAKMDYPGGMYISADQPSRSLRYTTMNDEKLILVGGENHKTGQGIDMIKHYHALEEYAEEIIGIEKYHYRWSAQDLITLDKVPYIGPITPKHSNIFVATGYRKWGMTNGTTAALILKDLIIKKENTYSEIFSPSRFEVDPSIKKFISINADVAGELLKGKLEFVPKDPTDLADDEGSVVMFNGKRAGAYKEPNGRVHIVDTTCTHLGCECEWNSGERTWDCPCHGSRFSYTGEVVEGPAKKPLKVIKKD